MADIKWALRLYDYELLVPCYLAATRVALYSKKLVTVFVFVTTGGAPVSSKCIEFDSEVLFWLRYDDLFIHDETNGSASVALTRLTIRFWITEHFAILGCSPSSYGFYPSNAG